MVKLKLDFEYEIDFFLIGISCHLPDYRLAYILNQTLKIDLIREKDLDLKMNKSKAKGYFSFYRYDNEELFTTVNLISNRCELGYFASELKQLDYFLQLWLPNSEEEELKEVIKKIKKTPQIIACIEIETENLKAKDNFIF